jgi:hypothetical protein
MPAAARNRCRPSTPNTHIASTGKRPKQLRSDLARIHRCIETGLPLSPEPQLRPGTYVEITQGALKGTRGKISQQGKHLEFIVEVQFLLQGISLEIDSRMIQPVTAEPKGLSTHND